MEGSITLNKIDTVVTLEDNEKYYLSEETEQNGAKYFLGAKLDENNNMTGESVIFEESSSNEGVFLDQVTDENTLNYISAIFVSSFMNDVEEMPSES